VDALTRDNPNIRLVNSVGAGPSAARNTAARLATGTFLYFLDADDCLRLNTLQTLKENFESNSATGVLFGRVWITQDPSGEGGVVSNRCESPTIGQILGENIVCTTSNITVRQDAFRDIGEFNEAMTHAEDQEWLARALLHPKWQLKGVSTITIDYRTSPGGLSSDLKKMELGWKCLTQPLFQRADLTKSQQREAKALFYRYLSRRALRFGTSRWDPIVFIRRALIAEPKLLWTECRRTTLTALAALSVALFGPRLFQNFYA